MTPTFAEPAVRSNSLSVSAPHVVWDVMIACVAVVTLLSFSMIEETPSGFWNGFGLQASVSLLLALALAVSVRLQVPNLAVPGIGVFASACAFNVVGDDGSSVLAFAIAMFVGASVGVVLAALVVGLRLPAWGVSIGLLGLLLALAIRVIGNSGAPEVIRRNDTLLDWGVPVLVAMSVFAVLVLGVAQFAPEEADDGRSVRDVRTILLHIAVLILSSALAGAAGALLTMRVGLVDGRIGSDLARPVAIVLLAGISLRGRQSGLVGLVAATIIIEISALWWRIREWGEPTDQLILVGVLGFIGLCVSGVLDLISTFRSRVRPTLPPGPPQ